MQTVINPTSKSAYLHLPPPTVEIVAVIDRSGSMASIVNDAIGGFNTFLKEQQEQPGEANLTIVLFADRSETVVHREPVKNVKPLTHETYRPNGSTALNDALGVTLKGLLKEDPSKAIVVILTDGEENASREYNTSQAKELIKSCEQKGWQVVYLGANQDAFAAGGALGIDLKSIFNFAATGAGVRSAYATASLTSSNYRASTP